MERLQRNGWEPFAHGARWYETRLRPFPESSNGSHQPERLSVPPPPPGLHAARPEPPKT